MKDDAPAFTLRLPIPPLLAERPLFRGFPVPWVALTGADGTPDFRLVDGDKRERCATARVCQLCGNPIGQYCYFTGGSQAAEHLQYFEPPAHLSCLLYAMQTCPFIAGKVEHTPVETVAARHAGSGVKIMPDATYKDTRDPSWVIVRSTGFSLVGTPAEWVFHPTGLLKRTTALFPEKMTAGDWTAIAAMLRAP